MKKITNSLIILIIIFSSYTIINNDIFNNTAKASENQWPCFRGNAQLNGQCNYDTSHLDGTEKWMFDEAPWMRHEPAIDDNGNLYLTSFSTWGEYLHILDSEGNVLLTKEIDGISRTPAIGSDGTIYAGSIENKLYAIDSGGEELWNFEASYDYLTSPILDDNDVIYFGCRNFYDNDQGKVYAIYPDGTEKWNFTPNGGIYDPPAISKDGNVYFGSSTGFTFYALNSEGEELWTFYTGSNIQGSPAVSNDGSIFFNSREYIYALDSEGNEKWNYKIGTNYGTPAISNDGIVYTHNYYGFVYAFNQNDGAEEWKINIGGHILDCSPVIDKNGIIYVGSYTSSDNANLFSLNPDGSERWKFPMKGDIGVSPVISSDGTVYIVLEFLSNIASYLYAIGSVDDTPVNSNEDLPDLIISDVKFSDSPLENGQPTSIIVTVENIGNKSYEKDVITTINFYNNNSLYPPTITDPGYRVALNKNIDVGESLEFTLDNYNTVPIYNEFGHNFYVKVDPLNDIPEQNEHNNIYYCNVPIDDNGFTIDPDSYRFYTMKSTPNLKNEVIGIAETFLKNILDSDSRSFLPTLTAIIWEVTDQGHCYGMSAASILYYQGLINKPVNKKTIDMRKTDDGVSEDIIEYQARAISYFTDYLYDLINRKLITPDEESIYESIKSYVLADTPVILVYDDHAVVAFDTYDVSDTVKHVLIYENANPGEAIIAEFDFEDSGIKLKQHTATIGQADKYTISKAVPYTADYLEIFIDLVKEAIQNFVNTIISVIDTGVKVFTYVSKSIYKYTENLWSNGLEMLTFWSPVDIEITDNQNRKISNSGLNEIPNAYYVLDDEVKVFYLPRNLSYTVSFKGTDEGMLDITRVLPISEEKIYFETVKNLQITSNTDETFSLIGNNSGFTVENNNYEYQAEILGNINNNDFPVKYTIPSDLESYNFGNLQMILIPEDYDQRLDLYCFDECNMTISSFNKADENAANIFTIEDVFLDNKETANINVLSNQNEFSLNVNDYYYTSEENGKFQNNNVKDDPIPDYDNDNDNSKNKSSGFEIIFLLIAIVLFIFFKRRRNHNIL